MHDRFGQICGQHPSIIFIMKDDPVSTIINHIISHSRRASAANLHPPFPQQTVEQYEEDDSEQEYIIQKRDLSDIIQKLVKQNVDKGDTIDMLEREIADLRIVLRTYEKQMQLFLRNQSKTGFEQNKEQVFKQFLEDLQLQYSYNRQLEQERKDMKGMLQQQVQETNRLKMMLREREAVVAQLTAKKEEEKQSTNNIQQHPHTQSFNPNRQTYKRLDSLPLINCESVDYSPCDSPIKKDPAVYPFKLFKTSATKVYQQGEFISSLKSNGAYRRQSNMAESQAEISDSKIDEFTELEKKDKIIRLLGDKCISLQQHISKLTRRLLGEETRESRLYSKPLQPTKHQADKRPLIEIEQQHKISGSSSNLQQSAAFASQPYP